MDIPIELEDVVQRRVRPNEKQQTLVRFDSRVPDWVVERIDDASASLDYHRSDTVRAMIRLCTADGVRLISRRGIYVFGEGVLPRQQSA